MNQILVYLVALFYLVKSDTIVSRDDYKIYCLRDYRCVMGMTACYSYGWVRNTSDGECQEPSADHCLDSTSKNCFKDSTCVKELGFVAKSETDFSCSLPTSDPNNSCATNCENNSFCSILGYYMKDGQCVKLGNNPETDCEGTPLCLDNIIDQVCRIYGYINNNDENVCRKVVKNDCLLDVNIKYCNSETSYCVKNLGFTYDSAKNKCVFDCLQGYNCKEYQEEGCMRNQVDPLQLGPFGFDKLNSQGKCYAKVTIKECVDYKQACPLACISKYNLIYSTDGCLFPPHKSCDQATETTEYGCSTNKEVCKAMGWSQLEKGSNKCADSTNTCLGQTEACLVKDRDGTMLGEYLGLILKDDIGWVFPTIDQCNGQNRCQRSQSECRKLGYLADNILCIQPQLEDCIGANKCSSKLTTICKQKYGFTSSSTGNTCVVPTNCSTITKGSFEEHACEFSGFISIDNSLPFIDMKDVYNTLNMSLDENYEVISASCSKSKYPLCSAPTSICRQIGFKQKSTGNSCEYPSVEECLVVGSGMCTKNHICQRIFKLVKSSTSDDCIIPNDGDHAICSQTFELQQNIDHYCFLYFGYPLSLRQTIYCKGAGSGTDYCSGICDIKATLCKPTKYLGYNSYAIASKMSNPFLSVLKDCLATGLCQSYCTKIHFVNVNQQCSIPDNCALSDTSYKHACHLARKINPNDLATCIGAANCSSLCQFYGFLVDADQKCKFPDDESCKKISQNTDNFYHACGFLKYGTQDQNIAQFCLEKDKNRCDPSSICVKYYNYQKNVADSNCQLPDYNLCLVSSTSLYCKVNFGFLLAPIKLLFTPLTDYLGLKITQIGLAKELGMILTNDVQIVKNPQPIDCLNKKLCKSTERFGKTYPYKTYCQANGFLSLEDGSCYLDINQCLDPANTCDGNLACNFSGFVTSVDDGTCLIMEKEKIYCHPSRKYTEKQELCENLGYKWVTDHYELPTHAECEENKNGYCKEGKTTCTSRGWTAVDGNCLYTINCLNNGNNYCQNDISICFYLGYTQIMTLDIEKGAYQYDCQIPISQKCQTKGQQNCASKSYSICVQQGYSQDSNSDCKCDGIIYQDKCIIVKTSNPTNSSSTATYSLSLIFTIKLLLLLMLVIL